MYLNALYYAVEQNAYELIKVIGSMIMVENDQFSYVPSFAWLNHKMQILLLVIIAEKWSW